MTTRVGFIGVGIMGRGHLQSFHGNRGVQVVAVCDVHRARREDAIDRVHRAYAAERKQYGVAVGSFQAVQHLLADAHCLMEGSFSVAQHAAWAADELPPDEAVAAGRVAKAYCARAARTVCETAIQVHGGIGNTWDCMAHVYLRRALLSSQWFGDDGEQLHDEKFLQPCCGEGERAENQDAQH